jgi:Outer membrane protein beta-barrel domain
MKKVFFVTSLSLVTLFLNAQSHHDGSPHVELGLKAGLNIANLHVDNSSNLDSKASFYAGGLAHIHLTKYIAVQPELMFSGQGAKGTIASIDYTYNLNYINLPVLVQFMVGDGFRLETGPQPGLLVSAHQKSGGNSTDTKDNFKGYDFSWVFGLGYLTHSGFGVDARYNLGLSNINDVGTGKINNRVFAIGVFYQFKKM